MSDFWETSRPNPAGFCPIFGRDGAGFSGVLWSPTVHDDRDRPGRRSAPRRAHPLLTQSLPLGSSQILAWLCWLFPISPAPCRPRGTRQTRRDGLRVRARVAPGPPRVSRIFLDFSPSFFFPSPFRWAQTAARRWPVFCFRADPQKSPRNPLAYAFLALRAAARGPAALSVTLFENPKMLHSREKQKSDLGKRMRKRSLLRRLRLSWRA